MKYHWSEEAPVEKLKAYVPSKKRWFATSWIVKHSSRGHSVEHFWIYLMQRTRINNHFAISRFNLIESRWSTSAWSLRGSVDLNWLFLNRIHSSISRNKHVYLNSQLLRTRRKYRMALEVWSENGFSRSLLAVAATCQHDPSNPCKGDLISGEISGVACFTECTQ